jgi:small-conductance mechanosensitive channel
MCTAVFGHVFQIIVVLIILTLIPLIAYLAVGWSMAQYFITGIALGFGIALQPLFHHMINGIIFHLVRMDTEDSVTIDKYTGEICRVGLIHTFLKQSDGNIVMISNSKLEEHPIVVNKCPRTVPKDHAPSERQPLIWTIR